MAIGIYFASTGMSTATYEQVLERLASAGAGSPKGRTFHVSFGDSSDLQIFDVWSSQAEFDAFAETLMPILSEVGANLAEPEVMEVHNIIGKALEGYRSVTVSPTRKVGLTSAADACPNWPGERTSVTGPCATTKRTVPEMIR